MRCQRHKSAGRRCLLLLLTASLTGCLNPSTTLVNADGQIQQCEAQGAGALGMTLAGTAHGRCVTSAKHQGYVPVAPSTLGLVTTADTGEITGFFAGSSAPAAGIRVGDRLLRVNGQPAHPLTALMLALAEVQGGALVEVTVARGDQELTVPVRTMPQDPSLKAR